MGLPTGSPLFGFPSVGIPGGIPRFAAGTFVAQKAGWTSVSYTDAITKAPAVYTRPPVLLVLGEGRAGWFTPRQFTPPAVAIDLPMLALPPAATISIQVAIPSATVDAITLPPAISLPAVVIDLPTVTIPRVGATAADFSNNLAAQYPFDRDWGFLGITINWIRDGLRNAIGNVMFFLWSRFVQPQIDGVQNGVQGAINDEIAKTKTAINNAFAAARDRIQTAINQALGNTQAVLNTYRDRVNAALMVNTDTFDALRVQSERAINMGFAVQRDSLQAALEQFRKNTQERVNIGLGQVTAFSGSALNSAIPLLYGMLGLPEQTLITPLLYKSRLDGFDVFAPSAGAVIHYSAIGS